MRSSALLAILLFLMAVTPVRAQLSSDDVAKVMAVAVTMALADAGATHPSQVIVMDTVITWAGDSMSNQTAIRAQVARMVNIRAVSIRELIFCPPRTVPMPPCRIRDPHIDYLVRAALPTGGSEGITVGVVIDERTNPSGSIHTGDRTVLVSRSDDGTWKAERIVLVSTH